MSYRSDFNNSTGWSAFDASQKIVGSAGAEFLGAMAAQGANLAIEDAFVLARCCDAKPDLRAGLNRYQELRRPRVVRAIEAANANARNYHLSGVRRRVAHLGLQGMGIVAPSAFLNRLGWLYNHDVTTEA